MLLPDRALLAGLLRRCRAWEHLVIAEPKDLVGRRRLEDLAYTLCPDGTTHRA
ncbi:MULTISPECIES: DUF5133 domain-containing protein [unclassified Streptomyces]|uniref:DUF5133 domain-containing protein n=1 Tax=unclassified Streptomyces TaxID=2593676 RepID=UPI002DD8A7B5|nr:DUF5133 domain-containing protein [Streptomyces sp. NBC_01750]WSA99636.1 DUF5133 domain-containing protein [Streptomyces sp. NBC_01794]WSD35914.1 DUF5133 domain-containing protein [Streptomyces sp. NBC_01750]